MVSQNIQTLINIGNIEAADTVLEIPRTLNAPVLLLSVVPLRLLAYYVAVDKGLDVDMPRNLAKSVTVE